MTEAQAAELLVIAQGLLDLLGVVRDLLGVLLWFALAYFGWSYLDSLLTRGRVRM